MLSVKFGNLLSLLTKKLNRRALVKKFNVSGELTKSANLFLKQTRRSRCPTTSNDKCGGSLNETSRDDRAWMILFTGMNEVVLTSLPIDLTSKKRKISSQL